MKKMPPRSAPPFSGRDLLDMTYGQVDQYPKDELICARCKCRFVADTRRLECAECAPLSLRDTPSSTMFEVEFLTDNPFVQLPRKGRRSECYEFFANEWWELDPQANRREQVKDHKLIERLDRLSDRLPKRSRDLPSQKPFVEYLMLGSGRVIERRTTVKPRCDCLSDEMHAIYPDAGGLCPEHGDVCNTCGASH